jgi:hypothetical protein
MRKGWLVWAVGLALMAGAASAQQVGDGAKTSLVGTKMSGVYAQDSTGRVIRMDALGNVQVMEQYPANAAYEYHPGVISNVFWNETDAMFEAGVLTNRDSTVAWDCRGFNRAALLVWPSVGPETDKGGSSADSIGLILFALEMRTHPSTSSDSLNTYPVPAWLNREPTTASGLATAARNDTIGSLTQVFEATATFPLLTTALMHEKVVVLSGMALNSGSSRGRVIWTGAVGQNRPGVFPFNSWRLRCIGTYTAAGAAVPIAQSLRVRLRADLVLWNE